MEILERMPKRGAIPILVATLSLAVAACASSSSSTTSTTQVTQTSAASTRHTQYPLTIDNCGVKETFDKPPSRVLILNGASVAEVEDFIVLGLQSRILANSQSYGISDDPTMVARIKAIPTRGLTLNQNYDVPREEVLTLSPDLVVSTWSGGFSGQSGFATRAELAQVGIKSFVTPAECANGETNPSAADQYAYSHQSLASEWQMLTQLGEIFNVQARAAAYIAAQKKVVAAAAALNAGKPRKSVLVVYPGMAAAMSSSGVPAVFGGGIFDVIINAAGGTNPFAGYSNTKLSQINAEALAQAKVDVLVIGLYGTARNGPELAAALFKQFPGWRASQTKTYTTVADSFYVSPLEAIAVRKIALAIDSIGG